MDGVQDWITRTVFAAVGQASDVGTTQLLGQSWQHEANKGSRKIGAKRRGRPVARKPRLVERHSAASSDEN